ncbi:DUF899-domain-containing protein [Trematosphaeria pertusa]|uniref:DUF899-domain-containing protein n=1 Tax=Trematosphaeria pertusa TaxID=390896 RepID=A0A6A6I7L3_9PLEO|nr:DUF899-domain-containing protein [Trematosphaeria pertusa]KAF2246535.1 DUF899-domain-containing protein [Trematosphaeria pertusa]
MTTTLPDPSFLRWPSNSSEQYITARRTLLEAEYALIQQIEAVAQQRRALPPGPVLPTYVFEEGCLNLNSDAPPKQVTLADVAKEEAKKPLVVYHMMMGEQEEKACSGCSMFLDSLNGVATQLSQRINLIVVAKAPLSAIRAYALRRQWHNLRFLSSSSNSFNKDMGMEAPAWMPEMKQAPGFSVFLYEEGGEGEEGKLRFWYQQSPIFGRKGGETGNGPQGDMVVRGMDLLTPVWNILDITPEGRGEKDLEYDGK